MSGIVSSVPLYNLLVIVPEVNSHCTTKIILENHCDNMQKLLPCANVHSFIDSGSVSECTGV